MPETIALRLKFIRSLAKLTRSDIHIHSGIAPDSLASWEKGNVKMNEKSIQRCMQAFKNLGIIVSEEWLKFGEGEIPQLEALSKEDKKVIKLLSLKSPQFISYIDKDGKFLYVNQAYEKIFNLPAQKIINRTLKDLVGKGYDIIKPYITRTLNGEECTFEYPWEYEENRYRYLNINFIPDYDDKKQVKGFYSFLKDSKMQVHAYDLNIEKFSDLENFLPKINHQNLPFDEAFFLKVTDQVARELTAHKINCNMGIVLSMIANIYSSFYEKQSISDDYLKNLVRLAIETGYLNQLK